MVEASLLYFIVGCMIGWGLDIYRCRLLAQLTETCCLPSGTGNFRRLLTAAGTGMLFILAGFFCQPGLTLFCCWFFLSCLMLQALIDYDCQLLPDKISLLLLVAGFFYAWYFQKNLTSVALNLFIPVAVMLLIYLVSRGGMGLGDVKLSAALGVWLGADKMLLCLLVAFLTGGVAGMGLLLTGARKRQETIAFGPFLCLGAAIALLWGDRLLSWYWQFFKIS